MQSRCTCALTCLCVVGEYKGIFHTVPCNFPVKLSWFYPWRAASNRARGWTQSWQHPHRASVTSVLCPARPGIPFQPSTSARA